MIRVEPKEPADDAWKKWCESAAEKHQKMHAGYAPGGPKPKITDYYKHETLKSWMFALFNWKCAFCESDLRASQHGDVEHFRPKAGVVEEDGSPAMFVDDDGVEHEHPGYYWLAYDWTNLLPSCQKCNQLSSEGYGKGNYFPLRKPADGSRPFRAWRPGDEAREEALFVHPCRQLPSRHFVWLPNGRVEGRTEEGWECIRRLGLNREGLITSRQETWAAAEDKMLAYMSRSAMDAASIARLQREIAEWNEGRRPYSAAARVAIREETERRLRLLEAVSVLTDG